MSLYTWLNGRINSYHPTRYNSPYDIPPFIPKPKPAQIDISQIRDYILQLLDEKTITLTDQIIEVIMQHINDNIDLSVQENIRQAFSELGTLSEEEIDTIINN